MGEKTIIKGETGEGEAYKESKGVFQKNSDC